MKIAMIGAKRVPSREGGVEIHVEELAARFAAAGFSVTVFNRRKGLLKRPGTPKSYRGFRLEDIPTIDRKNLDAAVYSLFATVRALFGGYDVIHYHAEGPCFMLFLPHLLGVRTVATIHGLDWQRAKWGRFASRFLLLGERTAARYADGIVVLSPDGREYFHRVYGRETFCIPNGVNPPVLRAPSVIREKFGLGKDSYLLFLARIVPEKGLHYLLEAFSGVETDKKLVVAGSGSHSDGYVRRIEKEAEKDGRVILAGFVEGRELEELFSNAFLYVLPSDVEGMPISLLEAMSYGCRCLVSDIPENREVLGDGGLTFRRGDSGDLRDRIEAILREPPPAPEAGAAAVLDRFRWDRAAEEVIRNVYGVTALRERIV